MLAASEASGKLWKLFSELYCSMFVLGFVGFAASLALVSSLGGSLDLGLGLGLAIGGVSIILGIVMGTNPTVEAAWCCFGLELLILLMAAVSNPSLCGVLAALRAVYELPKVKALWTLVKLRPAAVLSTNGG